MPGKPATKTFRAVLERTANRLRWVIVRVPFDVSKTWGTRGQIRVQGEINSFSFRGVLFPTRNGEHFLIVNKKMQAGAKTAAGLTAKFCLAPDTVPRRMVSPSRELLQELKQSRKTMKFYESLSNSRRNDIAKWIAQGKQEETRRRRARQIVERLMETMEAEQELPPIMQIVFRQNPRAAAAWDGLSPSHRRSHLFRIFYYRDPESRMRSIAKCVAEILEEPGAAAARRSEQIEEWD